MALREDWCCWVEALREDWCCWVEALRGDWCCWVEALREDWGCWGERCSDLADGSNCESYLFFFHSFLTERMQNWNRSCGTGKNSILEIVPFVEVFMVPHVVWLDSGQTRLDNNVPRIQFFLVNFCIIFWSLSGCNSGHFPTRQFVHRTFWPDSPMDTTGQWPELSLLLLLIKKII